VITLVILRGQFVILRTAAFLTNRASLSTKQRRLAFPRKAAFAATGLAHLSMSGFLSPVAACAALRGSCIPFRKDLPWSLKRRTETRRCCLILLLSLFVCQRAILLRSSELRRTCIWARKKPLVSGRVQTAFAIATAVACYMLIPNTYVERSICEARASVKFRPLGSKWGYCGD